MRLVRKLLNCNGKNMIETCDDFFSAVRKAEGKNFDYVDSVRTLLTSLEHSLRFHFDIWDNAEDMCDFRKGYLYAIGNILSEVRGIEYHLIKSGLIPAKHETWNWLDDYGLKKAREGDVTNQKST